MSVDLDQPQPSAPSADQAPSASPVTGGAASDAQPEWSLRGSSRPRTGTVVLALVLGALGFGGLFAVGVRPLFHREHALAAEAERERTAPLRVAVVTPQPGAARKELALPGEAKADQQVDLFARTSGYLKAWQVDIGDRVTAGQALATIESPELDEELLQADAAIAQSRARVVTAEANGRLATTTLKRFADLREGKVVSEQSYSERLAADEVARAELEAARADVQVAEANQRRLAKLRSFETVIAPFAGVVTARNTEVGALVSAGSAPGAKPLFSIARGDVLRVLIDVPQSTAFAIAVGQDARIDARERPGQSFTGKVSRTAGAIDPASRSLRVEIAVANPSGALLAGMYVQVQISVPDATPPLVVPGSTLVFNGDGNQLALVRDGHVHFQPVTVAGDYGKQIGISSGLLPNDQVIANPSAQLIEGAPVEAVAAATPGH